MDIVLTEERSPLDRHTWERPCPKCGSLMELLRRLPPKWNWTGMEVGRRYWKCPGCSYLEPAKD